MVCGEAANVTDLVPIPNETNTMAGTDAGQKNAVPFQWITENTKGRSQAMNEPRDRHKTLQADIETLIAKIKEDIQDHGKVGDVHWGHVGTLGYIKDELKEIVSVTSQWRNL